MVKEKKGTEMRMREEGDNKKGKEEGQMVQCCLYSCVSHIFHPVTKLSNNNSLNELSVIITSELQFVICNGSDRLDMWGLS